MIDIEVGVKSIQDVIDLIPLLEEKGFIYRPQTAREGHILFACRDFTNGMDTHYIHVVIYGNTEWNNNIEILDWQRPVFMQHSKDVKSLVQYMHM